MYCEEHNTFYYNTQCTGTQNYEHSKYRGLAGLQVQCYEYLQGYQHYIMKIKQKEICE